MEQKVNPTALTADDRVFLCCVGMADRVSQVHASVASMLTAWAASCGWDAAGFLQLLQLEGNYEMGCKALEVLYLAAASVAPVSNAVDSRTPLPEFASGYLRPLDRAAAEDPNATMGCQVPPRDRWEGLQQIAAFTPWGCPPSQREAAAAVSLAGSDLSAPVAAAWSTRCRWLTAIVRGDSQSLSPSQAEALLDALSPSLTEVCRLILDVCAAQRGESEEEDLSLALESQQVLQYLLQLAESKDTCDVVGVERFSALALSLLGHIQATEASASGELLSLILFGAPEPCGHAVQQCWSTSSYTLSSSGTGPPVPGGAVIQRLVRCELALQGATVCAKRVAECVLGLAEQACISQHSAKRDDLWVRALHTLAALLSECPVAIDHTDVSAAVNAVAVPALKGGAAIQALGLRCVGLYALLPQPTRASQNVQADFVALHLGSIREASCHEEDLVRVNALQVLSDWVVAMPTSAFEACQGLDCGFLQGPPACSTPIAIFQLLGSVLQAGSAASTPMQTIAAEGLAKAMFVGKIQHPDVLVTLLSELLCHFCLPTAQCQDAKAGSVASKASEAAKVRGKQALSVFLPLFASAAEENVRLCARAVLLGAGTFLASILGKTMSAQGELEAVGNFADFSVFLLQQGSSNQVCAPFSTSEQQLRLVGAPEAMVALAILLATATDEAETWDAPVKVSSRLCGQIHAAIGFDDDEQDMHEGFVQVEPLLHFFLSRASAQCSAAIKRQAKKAQQSLPTCSSELEALAALLIATASPSELE